MKKIRLKTKMASASRWLDQIRLREVEAIFVVLDVQVFEDLSCNCGI